MPPRSTASPHHLFVSPSGAALPRWIEAFPKAAVVAFGTAIKPLPQATLVWLRLDNAASASEQLSLLQRSVGSARIIVLADRPDNEQALTLFSAGIRGYCNAHATAANLRQVASVVDVGGLWIGEALMHRLLASTRAAMSRMPVTSFQGAVVSPAVEHCLAALTSREQEVARAIANGFTNKEIARQLGITERTVKAHTSSVFQKLNARDRLHLALMVNGRRST